MCSSSSCRSRALGAAWEADSEPAVKGPLPLGDLFPDACLQSRCEEAIQGLDAQDSHKLGKVRLLPLPPLVGGSLIPGGGGVALV